MASNIIKDLADACSEIKEQIKPSILRSWQIPELMDFIVYETIGPKLEYWAHLLKNRNPHHIFFPAVYGGGGWQSNRSQELASSSQQTLFNVDYGDNPTWNSLHFKMEELRYGRIKGENASMLCPPMFLPILVPSRHWSEQATYADFRCWVDCQRTYKFKVMGIMVSQADVSKLSTLVQNILKHHALERWRFVLLGKCVPEIEKDTRIYRPIGYMEYEDIVPHCDLVIVGAGAGSVTVPVVARVPFAILVVGPGGDKSTNAENMCSLGVAQQISILESVPNVNDVYLAGQRKKMEKLVAKYSEDRIRRAMLGFVKRFLSLCRECGLSLRSRGHMALKGGTSLSSRKLRPPPGKPYDKARKRSIVRGW
jgi:hypothetical protein